MKKVMLLILLSALFSCKDKSGGEIIIETNKKLKGAGLNISLYKGPQWSRTVQFSVMKLKLIPQFAFWIEDIDGNYIDTLYVTKKFAKQDWPLMKYDTGRTARDYALPYWMNKREASGLKNPTKNKPLSDSVTSATPDSDFVLKTKIKEGLKEIVVLGEFNRSYDVNEDFHAGEKAFTDSVINGQPSIVYAVKIDLNDIKKDNKYQMKLIGHGGETGGDPALYKDTSKLTTALDMIDIIEVSVIK